MRVVDSASSSNGDEVVAGKSNVNDPYTDDPEETELLRLQAIKLLHCVQITNHKQYQWHLRCQHVAFEHTLLYAAQRAIRVVLFQVLCTHHAAVDKASFASYCFCTCRTSSTLGNSDLRQQSPELVANRQMGLCHQSSLNHQMHSHPWLQTPRCQTN